MPFRLQQYDTGEGLVQGEEAYCTNGGADQFACKTNERGGGAWGGVGGTGGQADCLHPERTRTSSSSSDLGTNEGNALASSSRVTSTR